MYAQHKISGIITNEQGETLIGATIQEMGTVHGTVSNVDGSYVLEVSSPEATLIFSYIGYKSQEIPL